MSEGSQHAASNPDSAAVNARVWHPWLRVNRIIRDVLTTRWDAEQWPVAKVVLRRTLTERRKLARDGWWY
jgi:hypothetical protein